MRAHLVEMSGEGGMMYARGRCSETRRVKLVQPSPRRDGQRSGVRRTKGAHVVRETRPNQSIQLG